MWAVGVGRDTAGSASPEPKEIEYFRVWSVGPSVVHYHGDRQGVSDIGLAPRLTSSEPRLHRLGVYQTLSLLLLIAIICMSSTKCITRC